MAFTPSENPITHPERESYTELRPFRFWCQKVLPLVYDDSLSYYELLCKVVDYLNKTMEDVDHMNTDMDTLYSNFQQFQEGTFRIYNELVDYVNDYFENLDVQEEINNKLDEMVTSGELVTILQPVIANEVSEWLTEHITPTQPTIDNTLTVSGAGADARITGLNLSTTFNPSTVYKENDIVLYTGRLYRCGINMAEAEAWDSSHWELISVSDLLTYVKNSVNENNVGVFDFRYGNCRFYDGYYAGSNYNGNGTQIFITSGDWSVLLVRVIKGKTINISGMPTTAGAQSVWLNSANLTDVKSVAWNAQQCNGTHVCETDWLAMSGFRTNGKNVHITYEYADDVLSALDETQNGVDSIYKYFLDICIIQYIKNNITSGKYYAHGTVNPVNGSNVNLVDPIRIYKDVHYSFKEVYGYFCTIEYDNGTRTALTDSTLAHINSDLVAQDDGYVYITIHSDFLSKCGFFGGNSFYNDLMFDDLIIDPNTNIANFIVENAAITKGNENNLTPWLNGNFTVNGNEITFVAPASGNAGFYLTPENRLNTNRLKIKCDVASNTGGQMTIHMWDGIGSNFGQHLYTIKSISSSEIIDIDLATVLQNRPNFDVNKWGVLVSNTGNDFTFVFNSITIAENYNVPDELDGDKLGTIIRTLYNDVNDINNVLAAEPLLVECGTGKQFTRLRDAIAYAETVPFSHVIVYEGTYDLTQEFAQEISAATGGVGIELKNNVYVEFLSGSYVKAIFNQSSEWISTYFQPFYAGGSGFTLDGLNIEAKNCRYCVHDERGGADVKYHNIYKNCVMKFTMDDPSVSGGTSHFMQCIGGGMGKYGFIEIIGGYYETINNLLPDHQEPITYHNGRTAGCDGKIFITGVFLADKGRIRISSYGTSTIKSKVYVSNCSMYTDVYESLEVPSEYTTVNFEVFKWCNEIRST